MAYVDQTKIQTLFKPQFVAEVFQKATEQSFVLKNGTRLPDMTSKEQNIDILSNLPIAYWAGADTSKRAITSLALKGKKIYAEELNVIIPISKNSLADSNVDLEALIKERSAEAIGKKLDQAIITGVGKPKNFREGIIPSCVNYSAVVAVDASDTVPMYSAIDKAMAKVEDSDYDANAVVTNRSMKSVFRNMVDANGQPLANTEIGTLKREIVSNGAWDATYGKLLVGDLSQIYYAIRQDVTVDVLTEGTIENPSDANEKYNLGQQRMIAIMLTMRMGWEIPDPVTSYNEGVANAFPFALVQGTSDSNTNLNTLTLTVTVKDNANTPAAIAGAKVELGGQTKTTDSNGQATFKVVPSTGYPYAVTAANKTMVVDYFTASASGAQTLAVALKPYVAKN